MHLVKLDVDKDFPPNVFQRNRRPVPKKLLLNGVPEAPSKSRRQNKNSVFQFEITQSLPPSQDDLPKSKGRRPREVGGVDNACLTQFILALEQKEKSSWVGSKRGGWHSTKKLFKRDEKNLHQLRDIITNCAKKLLDRDITIKSSWANINRRDHYNVKHCHSGYSLAACYYVNTDVSRDAEGEFVASSGTESIKNAPKPGMLLIFPGDMYHEVLKYKGNEPRISIACNI